MVNLLWEFGSTHKFYTQENISKLLGKGVQEGLLKSSFWLQKHLLSKSQLHSTNQEPLVLLCCYCLPAVHVNTPAAGP